MTQYTSYYTAAVNRGEEITTLDMTGLIIIIREEGQEFVFSCSGKLVVSMPWGILSSLVFPLIGLILPPPRPQTILWTTYNNSLQFPEHPHSTTLAILSGMICDPKLRVSYVFWRKPTKMIRKIRKLGQQVISDFLHSKRLYTSFSIKIYPHRITWQELYRTKPKCFSDNATTWEKFPLFGTG